MRHRPSEKNEILIDKQSVCRVGITNYMVFIIFPFDGILTKTI